MKSPGHVNFLHYKDVKNKKTAEQKLKIHQCLFNEFLKLHLKV